MPKNTTAIRGSNAVLTLAKSDATAEGNLGEAVINEYTLATVGRVVGVEVVVETSLEAFHEIGRRHPVALHSGDIRVRGRVQRAHVNGALIRLLLGDAANNGSAPPTSEVQPSFNLIVDLTDPASTAETKAGAKVIVSGVQFENWGVSVPLDDFVLENATFKAVRVTREDKETPS